VLDWHCAAASKKNKKKIVAMCILISLCLSPPRLKRQSFKISPGSDLVGTAAVSSSSRSSSSWFLGKSHTSPHPVGIGKAELLVVRAIASSNLFDQN
jgi:hypothetical protein